MFYNVIMLLSLIIEKLKLDLFIYFIILNVVYLDDIMML